MQNAATAMNKTEWLLMGLALALLAAAGLRPSIRGNDGVGHYVYLASLLRGGDLDFSDEYRSYDELKQYPYKFSELKRSPATGRPSNRYGIGSACFWAPFVLSVHGGLKLTAPALANTMSRPYEWAVGLGTAFWGSVGLALLYGRLRRRRPPRDAGAIVLGLILATPLGFYLYAHGSMSHGVGFFAATVLLLQFERAWHHPAPATFAGCGFWSAWIIMIRFQDASWMLVLGGALLWRVARGRDRVPRSTKPRMWLTLAAFPAGFMAVFWIQMVVWQSLYGSWLSGPMPYLDTTAGTFSGWPGHMIQALVSSRHGVLTWHPLYALGLAGLMMAGWSGWRGKGNGLEKVNTGGARGGPTHAEGGEAPPDDRVLARCGLAGFAAQLWLVGCWSIWWGGASFGNRFFISSLPFIALGLGRVTETLTTRRRRRLALAVLVILVLWNMGLLLQYATEMLPREDWVPWSRIVRQNLQDVPAFLFHRLTRR